MYKRVIISNFLRTRTPYRFRISLLSNMTYNPLRILSLDGGGVRGISSLYILKELMRQLAREYQEDNPNAPELTPRPCEYFDLICGTSTGGLIALMLGRLRMVWNQTFVILTFSLLTTPFLNTKSFLKKSSQVNRMTTKQPSIIIFSS